MKINPGQKLEELIKEFPKAICILCTHKLIKSYQSAEMDLREHNNFYSHKYIESVRRYKTGFSYIVFVMERGEKLKIFKTFKIGYKYIFKPKSLNGKVKKMNKFCNQLEQY